ncbi:MAG TPA: DMT family transporter [Gaiellaceae bacterium]
MTAVLLALGASLTWGFADFGAGLAARRTTAHVAAAGAQLSGLVLVGIVVLATGEAFPSARQAAWAVFAGVAAVVGLSAFYRALSVGTMGIVGPITATGAIVPLAFGLARGEHPDALQGAGVALAIVGVIAASLERVPEGRRLGRGVGLACVAAFSFGWSLVGLSRAAPGGVAWGILLMRVTAVPLVGVLALLVTPRGGLSRWGWIGLAAVGVGDAGATLLYGAASTRGLLSLVAVLSSLYPIVIVVLGRIVLAERVSHMQLSGVAVALAGVALISAG